jgi:Chromo (CHRromatin Organisation MOdifier) domain
VICHIRHEDLTIFVRVFYAVKSRTRVLPKAVLTTTTAKFPSQNQLYIMSPKYSLTVNIKGIRRNRDIRVSPEGNSDYADRNDKTSQPPPDETHCDCELVLYYITPSNKFRFYRARRSCVISTPHTTGSQPYSDDCTIQIRTPFTIPSECFKSVRPREKKRHTSTPLPPGYFAAHIALRPIHGRPFPPPMFNHESCEFEIFDHLEEGVAQWNTIFNPSKGDLTTAILNLPVLGLEKWEITLASDILMLSTKREFGKWNFALEVQVSWDAEWEVETIEGERGKGDSVEFLVQWKGFKKRTWEPMCNLQNAPLAIEEWGGRNLIWKRIHSRSPRRFL